MAPIHPFRIFQKNQKGCLAGATLLAMISFLFLGVIIQLLGGRGGPGSQIETYAECRNFGDITSIELQRLSQENETLRRFLFVLRENLTVGADEAKLQALYPLEMLIGQVDQMRSPEQLINAWLITQYAQSTGIAPDWNDVQNLLTELSGNYLSDTVYDETLLAVGISQQTVEYLLTRYIAQQQVSEQLNLSVGAISPATRWDWYQRLYRQVTVEAAAVSVDSFLDKVPEPSADQLNAFYEEHKEKKYNPISDETGFIMPTEIAIQYVVAKPNQQMLDSISEEEMLAYYEANKETLFRKQTRPLSDYPQLPGGMPMMPGGLGGSLPFPTPDRQVIPMPTPAVNESVVPAEAPKSEEPVLEPQAPSPEEPVSEELKTEEPAAETSSTQRVTLRYVSYQAEEESGESGGSEEPKTEEPKVEEPAKEEPKAEEPKVEEPAKEEPKAEEPKVEEPAKEEPKAEEPKVEEPAKEEPKTEEPKVEEPAKEEPKTEEPKVEEPAKEEPKTEEPKVEEPAKEEPKTEEPKVEEPAKESEPVDLSILYRPFDEVKDQIRNTLAQEKAIAKLPMIQEKMQEYATVYNEQFEQGKTPPPMPDLTPFAKEQGLELVTVPMGDVYAAMRTELARGIQERNLIAQLYFSTPSPFESALYAGSNGQLLYWVTEHKPEKRPESIDDVKDVVLQRWKEIEARSLAQKKAEELLSEAQKANKPLAEVFAGQQDVPVVETEPFTWKTYGGVHPLTAVMSRQPPMLSEVREKGIADGNAEIDNKLISAPGTDFMKGVFALELGQSAMVFNQPKTQAYIVRVTSSSPSPDVLWERFQTSFYMEYFFAGQPEMMAEAYEAWLADIQKKTGFKWIKKPDYQY